jgi:hypothetical protein
MIPTTKHNDPDTQHIIHPVPIVVMAGNADPDSLLRLMSTPDCMLVCSTFLYTLCSEFTRNMTMEAPICENGQPGHPNRFVFTPNPLPLPPLSQINPEPGSTEPGPEPEPEPEPGS